MSPRLLVALCTLFLLAAGHPPRASRNTDHASRSTSHASSPTDDLPSLCPPLYHLQHPADCPDVGPGGYAQKLTAAGVSYPLPPLEVTPIYPYFGITPDAYGKVLTDSAPVYGHPVDALAGWPPVRTWGNGFVFVSLMGQVIVQGKTFYQINPGEFMRAEDVEKVRPSTFQGTAFTAPPATAVGWLIHNVQLSAAPGQPPAPGAPSAGRYQPFQVLGVQKVGDWNWYLIGPEMWVEQREVALVQPAPPPGAEANVIAVDTYEQTLGFYQNGQLVYAALVSSGSRYFPTRPGMFKIWARLTRGKMSGAYLADRRDYYFLEDVPWILYYDGDRALHGAYWHDKFGARSSHGCVNLSPKDARWLFEHARVGTIVVVFSSGGSDERQNSAVASALWPKRLSAQWRGPLPFGIIPLKRVSHASDAPHLTFHAP